MCHVDLMGNIGYIRESLLRCLVWVEISQTIWQDIMVATLGILSN